MVDSVHACGTPFLLLLSKVRLLLLLLLLLLLPLPVLCTQLFVDERGHETAGLCFGLYFCFVNGLRYPGQSYYIRADAGSYFASENWFAEPVIGDANDRYLDRCFDWWDEASQSNTPAEKHPTGAADVSTVHMLTALAVFSRF